MEKRVPALQPAPFLVLAYALILIQRGMDSLLLSKVFTYRMCSHFKGHASQPLTGIFGGVFGSVFDIVGG